jgi:hypothetical protein
MKHSVCGRCYIDITYWIDNSGVHRLSIPVELTILTLMETHLIYLALARM